MTPTDYPLVAPNRFVLLLPLAVGVLAPLGILFAMLMPQRTPIPWYALSPALVMPLVAAGMAWNLTRLRVNLSDAGLRIRRLPWPRTLPMAAFDLEHAEIADLGQRKDLLPFMKIVGTRVPGYRSGRFRLRDKRKASVLITDLRRVLVLPLRDGSVVMLSVERPDALLQAMRGRR